MSTRAISSPRAAAALLAHPLRPQILARARSPISASDLARLLGQPRQRVNYHVRQLAAAGFLQSVAQQKKRNMLEQQYVASAHAYVLSPAVLGEVAPAVEENGDAASASHLVALCSRAQTEVAVVMQAASDAGVRARTLSMQADLRFDSAEQRAEFSRALAAAVDDVVKKHSSQGGGRPFRLIVGCYPVSGTSDGGRL
jgi:hypothetical protein